MWKLETVRGRSGELMRLSIIMSLVAVGTATAAAVQLYSAALDLNRHSLSEIVEVKALMIGAVVRHTLEFGVADESGQALHDALSQLESAQSEFEGFRETGKFVLARGDGDSIESLSKFGSDRSAGPRRLAPDSANEESIRRALRGEVGTMIGVGHDGQEVMTAYRPVPNSDLGLVATVDMAEIQAPFRRAAAAGAVICLALIGTGLLLFVRIGNPMIRSLALSELRFRTMFEQAPLGVALAEPVTGIYSEVNARFEMIVGRTRQELAGLDWMSITHPDDLQEDLDNVELMTSGKIPGFSMDKRILRPDGSVVWIAMTVAPVTIAGGNRQHLCMMEDITARKRDEAALEQANLVVENSPVVVFCWRNTEGWPVEFVSKNVTQFGYTPEELLSGETPYSSLLHPHDLERVLRESRENNASGADEWQHEYRLVSPNGDVRWVEDHTVVQRDADGNITHYRGIVIDITNRRLREAALKKSEQYFGAIFEAAVDGIAIIDGDGAILEWNQSASEIFGYEKNDVVGESITAMIPDRARARHVQGFESLTGGLANLPADIREVTGLRNGGEEFPLEISLSGFGQEGKQFCGVVCRDVSERHRQEEDLTRLAVAIDQVHESVLMTDSAGAIQYVNPAFESVTGYCAAEVIGENPRLLKSGTHDLAFYENYWNTLTNGEVWKGQIRNRRKDGALIDGEMTVSPVFGKDGVINNYISVTRDLSTQRQLESQLRQSQKMEAVGRLAGGIAHDFNNLLTAILGFADLGLDSLKPGQTVHGDLLEIRDAGERAADLTRQLLAFSRQQVLRPQVLDLNEIVTGIGTLLHRTIGEDVELATKLDPALHRIKADKAQLEQVLLNLAINARDAMPEGGELTLETENVIVDGTSEARDFPVEPGAYVALTVSDTGCGMSEEVCNLAFEPFYTTKPEGKGTGLGLATVYGIVKQSGGYVWLDSEPGQGTSCKVLLPEIEQQSAEPAPESIGLQPSLGARTILVVEDNAVVLTLTSRILEERGHRVLKAKNAEDALRLSRDRSGEFDLLLSDIGLPKMDGLTLARELQLLRPGLPVILMSGYAKLARLEARPDLAGFGFLPKPFVQKDLMEKVGLALTVRTEGERVSRGLEEGSAEQGGGK